MMSRTVEGRENKTAGQQATLEAASPVDLPEHLMRLMPGGQWAVWRWVCLRGAGFPAMEVLRLSSPESARAADALSEAEERVARSRRRVLTTLEAELEKAAPEDYERLRDTTRDIRQRLKKGKLPGTAAVGDGAREALDSLREAQALIEPAQAHFIQTYENEVGRISETICEIAGIERFREAVVWQARHAFNTGIKSLQKLKPGETYKRNTRQRQHEELVASYLQRYCVKNDTVGFFGPVGWARFMPDGPAVSARAGEGLLAKRSVYFESWCIDTLIEDIVDSDRTILHWAAPRLAPVFYVEGQTLRLPLEKPLNLSAAQAALIRACDGEHTAREIARSLVSEHGKELRSESDVYRLLEYLKAKGIIYWTFEVPFTTYPEQSLRRMLDGVDDEKLRENALAKLDALEDARNEVAKATGNAEKLDGAIGQLQTTFTEVTGRASSRAAGKMYAGRALVYEDCRRDIEVDLGPEMLNALGLPLELLLTSARWLTYQVAVECSKAVKRIYAELAKDADAQEGVDSIKFWLRAQRELLDPDSTPITALQASFHDRWAEILQLQPDEWQINRTAESLKERVYELFDAPRPGWMAARYQSPDVMVVAENQEAIQRGDFELVMGELHVSINTVGLSLFLEQHPSKQELFDAAQLDIPEPRIIVAPPKYGSGLSGRNHMALTLPKDFRLEFAANSDKIKQGQALPLAMLLIEERDGELIVKTRDGQHEFEIVEVLADALASQVVNAFKLLRPANHMPRVKIDRVTVARESWAVQASEIEFAFEKSGASRFAGARRWARAAGMPRFVFMKSPIEVKPVYVDLESPIYVDLFAKIIRRTKESSGDNQKIMVSEMLPRLDQTWLPDKEGQHYTSEFRIVAVDLAR
ncbi:MAG TPA: lantibiotic dehydratase [Pyrinomonadaceae bacterium]|nr:lantibiotic dehydratase [Pyrinomonadaceae bacterium]